MVRRIGHVHAAHKIGAQAVANHDQPDDQHRAPHRRLTGQHMGLRVDGDAGELAAVPARHRAQQQSPGQEADRHHGRWRALVEGRAEQEDEDYRIDPHPLNLQRPGPKIPAQDQHQDQHRNQYRHQLSRLRIHSASPLP